MNPSANDYLSALLSSTRSECCVTEKVKTALLYGLRIARSEDVSPSDDAVLYGLLKARTVAIPVFDSAGVNISKLSRALRQDLAGRFYPQDDFAADIAMLRDDRDRQHCAAYGILALAQHAARRRNNGIIDSGVFLEALFRQSTYGTLDFSDKALEDLYRTPVSDRIKDWIAEWEGLDPSDPLSDIVDDLSEYDYAGSALRKLAPFVSDVTSLARLEDTLHFSRNVEPYLEGSRFLLLSDGQRAFFREFDYLNSYRYGDNRNPPPCKISTFTGAGLLTWNDTEELEALINRTDVTEYDIQKWMEKHPHVLLGSDYDRLHSQIVLMSNSGSELIPDFFAERIDTGFADIIELKRPSARIVSGQRSRRGLSAVLTQSLNQVREYRNYFDNPGMAKWMRHSARPGDAGRSAPRWS